LQIRAGICRSRPGRVRWRNNLIPGLIVASRRTPALAALSPEATTAQDGSLRHAGGPQASLNAAATPRSGFAGAMTV